MVTTLPHYGFASTIIFQALLLGWTTSNEFIRQGQVRNCPEHIVLLVVMSIFLAANVEKILTWSYVHLVLTILILRRNVNLFFV